MGTELLYVMLWQKLTHCGQVTQICIYALQLWKTDDAHVRF